MNARNISTIGLLPALLIATGCARPAVTVEQVHEEKDVPRQSSGRVFPPACEELPTAVYPELPPENRPELVSVRVDLTISRGGQPENLRATVQESIEPTEPFVEAALAAARTIRCEGARRTPRRGTDELALVPIDYESSIVFRFYRDEKEARGAF